jgi:hypothetical protein
MNSNSDLLAVLTREGVLINASVRYPRFHKKLSPADLGLSPEQVSERLVSLGHKKLLPKEALAELALVEGRTHAIIDQGTFPFLGGLGHFLPNGKLVDVQEQLNAQRSHFHRAKETFLAAYRDLRSEALAEWEIAIRHIAGSRDEASCLYAQIAESFPAREKLADRFAFEVHLFQIAVPESLGMELVSFAEQQEVRLARREAAETAARQIRSGVEGFVGECITELRHQTAQLCDEMLSAMRTGKTDGVHQKTLNRLVKFIDDFKSLNFAGDVEMERQLDQVRKELLSRSAEDYRQSPSATRSLQDGLTQLRDQARELANQDARELVERFGQVGRRRLQMAG